ncbi:MAG: branched-chain amino acid ABC transporter permease [Alphaproteobacteria bacterium]|nr:branched-chain amino acid ABC transporter permease [Alphaproteobacteria bacterium]
MSSQRLPLLALLAAAIALPLVFRGEYFMHLMIMVLFYTVLASSLNIVTGYIGQLSLGHAAFFGIGCYAAAMLTLDAGWSVWTAMIIAGLAAAVAGFVIGYITLRLDGHYFVLITLAFAEVLRLVVINWEEVTRGPLGFPNIPRPSIVLGGEVMVDFSSKTHFYYVALVLVVITLWAKHRFVYSAMGRASVAIRENPRLAQSVGIDPFYYSMVAFVLGAFFAGLSGWFYAHYISYVGPDVYGFGFMVTMLIMIAVGGRGTIVGPVIGAAIITIVVEELRFAREIRLSLFGLLLMLSILFFPRGLVSVPDLLRRRGWWPGAGKTGTA